MRSAERTAPVAVGEVAALSPRVVLWSFLAVGLVLRLLLIPATGFGEDVLSFEGWATTLGAHPLREFYAQAGFADYPPGYFFVLAAIGRFYATFVHGDSSYAILKALVKLPAIAMDIVDALLVFAIVRKLADVRIALASAAAVALNPAIIYISGYWGQVDSVPAGFVLGALALLVYYGEHERRCTRAVAGAWALLAISILIKPPAVVLVPLFFAYAFATAEPMLRALRVRGTILGVEAALVLAYLAALAFHPGWNPYEQFAWLYGRYAYASGVYAYNSINAFNLYAVFRPFWQPDSAIEPGFVLGGHTIGLPQYVWGILLTVGALALIVARYVKRQGTASLVEGAFLALLAFFILPTRMHERYVFDGLMLAIAAIAIARTYAIAATILTFTLFANLLYSIRYMHVMDASIQGVDASNLMPLISHPAAFANCAVLAYFGYRYLRTDAAVAVRSAAASPRAWQIPTFLRGARQWFAPGEGLARMTGLDYAIAAGMTLGTFALAFVNYAHPRQKIFDEIYYARAGSEYLRHIPIFEYTHPPLTKLVIALSMMLFGGVPAGDTSAGWRFLQLVVGSLMIFVAYAFAKRVLRSTTYASVAALVLAFDGFHFVQSRIATPEITVAFFSLTTLYAFYRFWIASQVRRAPELTASLLRIEVALLGGASIVVAALTAMLVSGQSLAAHVVLFIYLEIAAWVAIRLVVPRFRRAALVTSYPDGSIVRDGTLVVYDGRRVSGSDGDLRVPIGDATFIYRPDGRVRYETPAGTGEASPGGTFECDGATLDAGASRLWFALLAISAAALAASKWNGLFTIGCIFTIVTLVAAQRIAAPALRAFGIDAKPLPAVFGNPLGFSVDLVVGGMLLVIGAGYALSYIPFYFLGHNFGDMISLQHDMFEYHDHLVATHPYSSVWWQWPLLLIPVSYFWQGAPNNAACCVREILALPNPFTFWFGLVSVPFVVYLAWRERAKAYVALVAAYFFQWLPWILSPRLAFEYHFFPNVAIIAICDALALQRFGAYLVALAPSGAARAVARRRSIAVTVAFCLVTVATFAYFYPVLAGVPISQADWNGRMLTWLMGNMWINPHPNQ